MSSKFKSILKYSGSVYLSQIFNILSLFIIPKFLTPVLLGKFNLLQVFYGYMDYSHIGIRYGLDKEIPVCIAKNDMNRAEHIANVGISGMLIITILLDLIIFIVLPFISNLDRNLFWGSFIIFLAASFYNLFSFAKITLRAHENISQMSRITVIWGLLWSILRTVGVIMFRFYGLLFGILLSNILVLFIILNISDYRTSFVFDFKELKALFKMGLPLLLFGVLSVVFRSLDKWVIVKFLGFKQLGYYAIANMIFYFLLMLPTSINEVLFPGLLKKINVDTENQTISGYLNSYISISSKLFAVIIASIIIFIPFLIKYCLPQYIPGIVPAQILIIATYPLVFQGLFVYYLYGKNKHELVIYPVSLGFISFIAGSAILLINNMINLVSVASLMVISNFLFSYLTIFFSYSELGIPLKDKFLYFIKSMLPLYCVLFAFLIPKFVNYENHSIFKTILLLLFSELILIVVSLPMLNRILNTIKRKKI